MELITYPRTCQQQHSVCASEDHLRRILALSLLGRFNLYFILVVEKSVLLESDAAVSQVTALGKFSPRALQKKGVCSAVSPTSPLHAERALVRKRQAPLAKSID